MLARNLRSAIISLGLFTVITGIVYPLLVTGFAHLVFPDEANGSLIVKDGKTIGSELIGQPFSGPEYFWGRLSSTSPVAYNAAASSGSNYGPLNPAVVDAATQRAEDLRNTDPQNTNAIPVDLVTASASGLDPHISIASALYQVTRVARERSISENEIRSLVGRFTEGRDVGFLGEPGVNVLRLNLTLNELEQSSEK
jgi:K+-transporting ATPase ATPase C chain